MHSAQCPPLLIEGDVGLSDDRLESALDELPLAEDAGEEAPVILAAIHVENEGSLELRLEKHHD